MGVNLRGRSFLKLLDYTPQEIRYLLDLARNFKDMKRAGVLFCRDLADRTRPPAPADRTGCARVYLSRHHQKPERLRAPFVAGGAAGRKRSGPRGDRNYAGLPPKMPVLPEYHH